MDTKVEQIYQYLLQIIKNNANSGDLLPSENFLCQKFNYSRNTIRNAYTKLINNNLVVPIKGKGYVAHKKTDNALNSFKNHYGEKSFSVFLKTVEKKGVYNKELKTYHYYELHKIRYINDYPYIYTIQEIPFNIYRKLNGKIAESSLYKALENANIFIFYATKNIELIKTSKELKYYFQIKKSQIVRLISHSYNLDNKLLERSVNYYIKEFKWTFVEYNKIR